MRIASPSLAVSSISSPSTGIERTLPSFSRWMTIRPPLAEALQRLARVEAASRVHAVARGARHRRQRREVDPDLPHGVEQDPRGERGVDPFDDRVTSSGAEVSKSTYSPSEPIPDRQRGAEGHLRAWD